MVMKPEHVHDRWDPEPRWPALIAILAVAGLYTALPAALTIGPRYLFLEIVLVLVVPTLVSHWWDYHRINRICGFLVNSIITLGMVISIALLIQALPEHKEPPARLLLSAGVLWLTNILVFALWYWRLDAGGPHGRDATPGHLDGAFLFPQMTIDPVAKSAQGLTAWSPNFVDYLFLAFNTSTAFSPTDAPVLSRWAKILTMIQSLISLTVIAVLAARAINIL